jgi:chitodextrinase
MSEFKISRIRYTWRGTWATASAYNRDDVVKYGGAAWVCFRQHTAGVFPTDQIFLANPSDTDPTPAWRKIADGYVFRNTWQPSILYDSGDIVINGGTLYLCVASYTSTDTFEDGITNWVVYGYSLSYKNEWTPGTRYGAGDVVKYNGLVYKCIQGHTAADNSNGLEQDQSKWQLFYEGVEYVGQWTAGTRYRKNDLVTFGGTMFRCKEGHTAGSDSTINFDQEGLWEIEFLGFNYSAEWNDATVYSIGDLVNQDQHENRRRVFPGHLCFFE